MILTTTPTTLAAMHHNAPGAIVPPKQRHTASCRLTRAFPRNVRAIVAYLRRTVSSRLSKLWFRPVAIGVTLTAAGGGGGVMRRRGFLYYAGSGNGVTVYLQLNFAGQRGQPFAEGVRRSNQRQNPITVALVMASRMITTCVSNALTAASAATGRSCTSCWKRIWRMESRRQTNSLIIQEMGARVIIKSGTIMRRCWRFNNLQRSHTDYDSDLSLLIW